MRASPLVRMVALSLLGIGACTPSIPEAMLVCDATTRCPPGWSCNDGVCVSKPSSEDSSPGDSAPVDATLPVDATKPDAGGNEPSLEGGIEDSDARPPLVPDAGPTPDPDPGPEPDPADPPDPPVPDGPRTGATARSANYCVTLEAGTLGGEAASPSYRLRLGGKGCTP